MRPTLLSDKVMIFSIALFLSGMQVMAQRQPDPTESAAPKKNETEEKKKPLRIDPLADPVKEMARRAREAAIEKNYNELRDAASELAALSKKLSDEISEGGRNVISAKIFEDLDKVEKLAKRMRDKAKGP